MRQGAAGNIYVERAELAKHLLEEARRMHPAIDFEFDLDPVGGVHVTASQCPHFYCSGVHSSSRCRLLADQLSSMQPREDYGE